MKKEAKTVSENPKKGGVPKMENPPNPPKKQTIADLKEEVEFYKKMSEYYKKQYNESIVQRQKLAEENVGLVASFERIDRICAQYENQIKKQKKSFFDLFKF